MKEKIRLDKLLVLKGHVENVTKAKALIMSGKVLVDEIKIEKPGTKFTNDIIIRLLKKSHDWVSRGGIKLEYAINELRLNIKEKVCADLGSSTGGFTDVLLRKNAKHVYCVDVGKGLLDWKILNNKKQEKKIIMKHTVPLPKWASVRGAQSLRIHCAEHVCNP